MQRDEVNQHEEQYVGEVVRLEIPLKSVMNLRRIAEELRGLATQLDHMAMFSDDKPSVVMLRVRAAAQRTNQRLVAIRGRGRPKRSRHKF
jgi:hypothetical protein